MLFPLWERRGLERQATVVSLKVPLNATNSFSVWVVTQSLSPWMARSVALSSSRIWSVYFLSPHLSGKNPNSCLSFYNSPCNLVLFLDESGNSVQPSFALLICHKYISWLIRTDGSPPLGCLNNALFIPCRWGRGPDFMFCIFSVRSAISEV